jgi:phosphomannomutase
LELSHLAIIRWSLDSHQSQLAVAFGIIFVAVLGGEGSGHIICLEQTTSGDGIIAALQVG